MYVILLEFADAREKAGQFMAAHKAWIDRGIEDGTFLLVGSLQPNRGGAILAAASPRTDLESRVADDPFVAEGIVSATIHEITPAKADPRLAFLTD